MIDFSILENHPRYKHSVGVMEMALKLNDYYHYGVDANKITVASMLHDYTKNYDDDSNLELIKKYLPNLINEELLGASQIWHSFSGSIIAEIEFNINDSDILNAIYYHTIGRPNMSALEKLIFISDYIEKNRIGTNFEIVRKLAFQNIDYAICVMLEEQFKYLRKKGMSIYSESLKTYEYYKEGLKNDR